MHALNSKRVRTWLAKKVGNNSWVKEVKMYFTGETPINKESLDDLIKTITGNREATYFLDEISRTNKAALKDIELLIVGEERYNEEIIRDLIVKHAKKPPEVYTQQMFIFSLFESSLGHRLTKKDFTQKMVASVASAFGKNHPAINYIKQIYKTWPGLLATERKPADKTSRRDEHYNSLERISPLRELGYTAAGKYGLTSKQRQRILKRAYNLKNLPFKDLSTRPTYKEQWGKARSKERLEKIADYLASYYHKNYTKGGKNKETAQKYKEDLGWLKTKYYNRSLKRRKFNFDWPRL